MMKVGTIIGRPKIAITDRRTRQKFELTPIARLSNSNSLHQIANALEQAGGKMRDGKTPRIETRITAQLRVGNLLAGDLSSEIGKAALRSDSLRRQKLKVGPGEF